MDAILEQFLNEARDNLSYLDQHLRELEGGESESVNALFRAAHTLKGGAGLVGFVSVKEITHKAEDLLDAYRNGKISFCPEMLDALYEAFDEVVELVDRVEEDGEFPEADEEKIASITENIASFLKRSRKEDDEAQQLQTQLRIQPSYPGFAQLLFEEDIAGFAQKLPFDIPVVDNGFLEQKNIYLLDFDLDQQTVEFGNDPLYLVYLLGEENISALSIVTSQDCEEVFKNPLQWKTRVIVVVESDAETIEDAIYNVIDEVTLYPLSVKSLLYAEDFDENFLKTRIDTLKSVLNEDLAEDLERFVEKEFGIKRKSESEAALSDKEKEVIKDLLSQQKRIISISPSVGSDEHVKNTLKRIFGYAGMDSFLNRPDKGDSLIGIIDEAVKNFVGQGEEKDNKSSLPTEKTDMKKENEEAGGSVRVLQKNKTIRPASSKNGSHLPKTVKVDQQDIDMLLNTVGELLVMKNALPYLAQEVGNLSNDQLKREINGKYEEISRVTEQLQEKIMNMRLLPLSYIFGRYPKMVRDIGKKLGKKIRYEESGGETKLDKTMIEKLADPLIHLIRNSLDHGLESERERVELGKDPAGVIKIEARSHGDRVFITIEDDGRGIDVDRVVMKALERKLINPDTADSLSRDEKLMLIFHPGLSTKDEISELSGRGVGADAVKKTIEELGGKITLKSQSGKGTILTMELPVSVALSNVFHVRMNRNNYAIDMDKIVETVRVDKSRIQTANHRPFINLRSQLIPLLYEETLLGDEAQKREQQNIVVIEGESNRRFGLVVDDFVNQLDVVQKPLSGSLKSHPLISGTSLLGNGDVLFIIDPLKIVTHPSGGKV